MNNLFQVFVIDPPWEKKKGGLRASRPNQGRELDYSTMSTPMIFSLLDREVFSQADKENHTVFLWTIDQYLHESENEMLKRGYRMHARLIWDKLNGVAPAFSIRYSHEYVIWFYKPKFMPVSDISQGKLRSVFSEAAREHSRKPDCFYKAIELWWPNSKKLDVFSREKRQGWFQYGNQVEHFNTKETK